MNEPAVGFSLSELLTRLEAFRLWLDALVSRLEGRVDTAAARLGGVETKLKAVDGWLTWADETLPTVLWAGGGVAVLLAVAWVGLAVLFVRSRRG